MITHNKLVQYHKNGATTPAGKLAIGDTIYDGLANKNREIVDIMCRTVDVNQTPWLAPIAILRGVCPGNLPRKDVLMSPQQELIYATRDDDPNSLARLECSSAQQYARVPKGITPITTTVTYVALFFETRCFMVCSGLLLASYTSDILESGHSPISIGAQT